jgi:hypothetical protein
MGGCIVLSEATVRVYLDLVRFERDLSQKVHAAAEKVGKDFDRDMRRSMAGTGRQAATDFGTAAGRSMQRAGATASSAFGASFKTGITKLAGDIGQTLGRNLTSSVGNAGLEAGRVFCEGFSDVLVRCGKNAGAALGNALSASLSRSMQGAERDVDNALTPAAESGGRSAGTTAAREFSLSFGIGTARAGRPILAAFAILGAEIGTQLGPALPIVAAMAPLLLGVASAAAITAAAFKGIGDAFEAIGEGDFDKITESMARLSPAARGVVAEFQAMKPALGALRRDIQDAFFSQLGGELTRLTTVMSGPLRGGITDVAASMGRLGRSFADAFTDISGVQAMQRVLNGTRGFIDQLATGFGNLLRGLLAFSAQAAPGFNSLGIALNRMLTSIGAFLQRSADSGKALEWVEGGILALQTLAATIADVGQAFMILLTAVRPIALVLGGVFDLAVKLISAFGELPAAIQTVALAALLFARSGLPDVIRRTTAETGPLRSGMASLADAYRNATAGATALAQAQGNLNTGVAGLAAGQAAAGAAAGQLAARQGVLTRSLTTVHDQLVRVGDAMTTGIVRSMITGQDAITRVGTALSNVNTTINAVGSQSGMVATSWRGGLVPAALALDQAVTRVGAGMANFAAVVEDRVIRTAQTAGNAVNDAIRGGFVPAAAAARIAVYDLGTATQTAFIRATLAAETGAARVGAAIQTGVIRASNLGVAAVTSLGSATQTAFTRAGNAAETGAARVNAAVQTGIIRASVSANAALTSVGTTLQNSVLRPLVNANAAYRATSASIQGFAAVNTALVGNLSQTPGLLNRVGQAFTNLGTTVASTGAALRAGFDGPVTAARNALAGLGTAATGAAAVLRTGLTSAASGIVGIFGGPWGVALAAAGAALSLLASQQDKARQAAAGHAAVVSQLADTLNRQTGAVTQSTRTFVADKAAREGWTNAAGKMGISSALLTNALLGQSDALEAVRQKMAASIRGQIEASTVYKQNKERAAEYGITLDLLSRAAGGSRDAQIELNRAGVKAGGSFNELISVNRYLTAEQKAMVGGLVGTKQGLEEAADAARDAAAAMTPAQRAAQAFSDALGVLADDAADADSKTKALSAALNTLAGDTITAETAQANFTDVLKSLDDSLESSTEGLSGMGSEMVTLTGRINPNSQAGAFLIGTYNDLNKTLAESSVAALEAGKQTGDLSGALATVSSNTQLARDQFIQTARQLGLNETQANALADAYGLIPRNVSTLVGTAGTGLTTKQEVQDLHSALKFLPPNTPVRVTALTQEARSALESLGYKIQTMPDGTFTIQANTAPAQTGIDTFIRNNSGRVIAVRVETVYGSGVQAVDANGRRVGMPAVAQGAIFENYATGGLRQMAGNIARIVPPNTWRVIGDRARDDEAYIPINRSRRSLAILNETARRMNFELLANGGVVSRASQQTTTSSVAVAAGAIVVNAPYSDPELVARAVMNELARAAVA